MDTSTPFKWRHFEAEIILLCVRWYLRYSLSYRDLEEMMRERGLLVEHRYSLWIRWIIHPGCTGYFTHPFEKEHHGSLYPFVFLATYTRNW
jgi:hypothetical protein